MDIIKIINSVGFPIAACIALYLMNQDVIKYQREMLEQFRSAIDSNTHTIQKLISRIEKDKRDED